MRARLLASLSVAFALTVPAWSHAPDSGSAPLEGTRVRLEHRTPQDIIALFSRATLPVGGHLPRSARAETAESVLPPGVDGILRGEDGEVILVGAHERCRELSELLRRLDEAVSTTADVVETRFQPAVSARELARQIRALPGGGTVKVEGSELRLSGSREWLFRALRTAIQSETRPVVSDEAGKL